MKGHSDKVKIEGQGLRGGYVGQELRAIVDTSEAGNGESLNKIKSAIFLYCRFSLFLKDLVFPDCFELYVKSHSNVNTVCILKL